MKQRRPDWKLWSRLLCFHLRSALINGKVGSIHGLVRGLGELGAWLEYSLDQCRVVASVDEVVEVLGVRQGFDDARFRAHKGHCRLYSQLGVRRGGLLEQDLLANG